jgi:hypothetical protein
MYRRNDKMNKTVKAKKSKGPVKKNHLKLVPNKEIPKPSYSHPFQRVEHIRPPTNSLRFALNMKRMRFRLKLRMMGQAARILRKVWA